eukprot:2403465-Pyramimonas_sp.AAC.1
MSDDFIGCDIEQEGPRQDHSARAGPDVVEALAGVPRLSCEDCEIVGAHPLSSPPAGSRRWRVVRGPIAATISTPLDIGLDP